MPIGKHKIEVSANGYRGFQTEVAVTAAASALLNISLVAESQNE